MSLSPVKLTPMLHLLFSNRYEVLRSALLDRLGQASGHPFVAQQVIVPSSALRRDITLAAADRRGIVANIEFGYLAQWLWRQIGRITQVSDDSPFAAPILTWRVYQTLDDAAFVSSHPRLQAWLRESDAVMRFEFAQRAAGLLEDYITYRPTWLERWLQGIAAGPGLASPDALADQAWQADLWRRLHAQLALPTQDPIKTVVSALSAMTTNQARACGLPAEVHVFALPAIAPLHLDLLRALGQVCTVHLYVLNPCEAYWFDLVAPHRLSWLKHTRPAAQSAGLEAGHPLLTGWGGQTQSHIGLLIDRFGEHMIDEAVFEPPDGHTLLAQLQTSMLTAGALEPGALTLSTTDRSIEVRVCHSLTRELEVLHDHLLGLFAGDVQALPDLKPWDVLVVTPDLEAAAPLIEGVFGAVPDQRRIDWTITGRARSRVNAPARALLSVLSLVGSRVPASELFSVLQQDPIARRFELDDVQLLRIHAWIRDSGFRWAFDADHLIALNLPAHAAHTLSDALERLFLGYALPDALGEPFNGYLPSGSAEGHATEALGRLWRFIQALGELRDRSSMPLHAEQWGDLLGQTLRTFIQAQGDQLEDLRDLHGTLHQLVTQMQAGGFTQAVGLQVVRAALQALLDDPARGGVPGGAVTFASMNSLRGLPYRVICAIGLNSGSFPGTQQAAEFDLIALKPQAGDRQRRIDERNVFLDLLLSARDMFYLSYAGHSIRDNSPLPPSVLIDELLDTLSRAAVRPATITQPGHPAHTGYASSDWVRGQLVLKHPLQAFAPEGFAPAASGADPRLLSFNSELAQALRARDAHSAPLLTAESDAMTLTPSAGQAPANASVAHRPSEPDDSGAADTDADAELDTQASSAPRLFPAPLPAPGPEWRTVSLERLIAFFRHPARSLLTQRLGLSVPEAEDALVDEEPFILTRSARRALSARLLPALLQGQPVHSLREIARAGVELPAGVLGERALDLELDGLASFAHQVHVCTASPKLPDHDVNLSLELEGEHWQLKAHLSNLYSAGVIAWRYAPLRAADRLSSWIELLVAGVQPPAHMMPQACCLAQDGLLRLQCPQDPLAILRTLLTMYRRGMSEPLHFFPQTAWAYMQAGERLAQARQTWLPSYGSTWSESQDTAWRLALRGIDDPLDERFTESARTVFGPLMEHTLEQP